MSAPTMTPRLVGGPWTALFLGGSWVEGDGRERIADWNPATGELLAEVPGASLEDVDRAFAFAQESYRDWGRTPPQVRSRVLLEAHRLIAEQSDDIVDLLIAESGSTRVKARFEVESLVLPMLEEAASFPGRARGSWSPSRFHCKENLVERVPVGVVAVISPWNFPLHLSLRAVGPALALGNSVVLKPASDTPITGGLLIARIFEAAGLPAGLLNVIPGQGYAIGDHVSSHPGARVVAFTGSTEVGRRVAERAACVFARPALELGGNNPHVVLEDADLDRALASAVFGSFLHQGQICIRINRHLVHRSLYDEYSRRLAERASKLPVGDPRDPRTIIGPVINASQRDKIMEAIQSTIARGAKLLTGGTAKDLFIQPTVLRDVTPDMPAAKDETFGPVAPVLAFDDDEEAIEIANGTEYGLAASVCSRDLERARSMAERLDAGMVHVNDQTMNDEATVPFGGVKASGMGRYNGRSIIQEMTDLKWISIQHEPREYPFS